MSDKQYVTDLARFTDERAGKEMDVLSPPVAIIAAFTMQIVDKAVGLPISNIMIADEDAYKAYCILLTTLAQLGHAVGSGEEIPSPPDWLEYENELAKAMVEAINGTGE